MKRRHYIISFITAVITFGALTAGAMHFKHHKHQGQHEGFGKHCWAETETIDNQNE